MSSNLNDRTIRDLERKWALEREAIRLLDLVNAEWKSDPMSVQCFDARIVRQTDDVLTELNAVTERLGGV